MSARPLFSVIIPTYNRARKVARAVESVLAQTCQDFDVWVIDDGSTDETARALAPYEGRIHYKYQKNGGVASARNHGMLVSAGVNLAFLDSDDQWYPRKLECVAAAIRAHPDGGLFYSACDVVDETGQRLWIDRSRDAPGSAYEQLLLGNFLALSSAVVRRDVAQRAGEFDADLVPCEDWDYWLRISRAYPIVRVPEALVIFEYASTDKLTARTHRWLEAHDRVVEKAFRRDAAIRPAAQRAIRANLAYVKGRVCLEARDDREAARWFGQAAALRPALFKAQFYRLLSQAPWTRRFLPDPLRRRLRLPAPEGSVH